MLPNGTSSRQAPNRAGNKIRGTLNFAPGNLLCFFLFFCLLLFLTLFNYFIALEFDIILAKIALE
jgi:ABC-type multidrug transport system permease subunit